MSHVFSMCLRFYVFIFCHFYVFKRLLLLLFERFYIYDLQLVLQVTNLVAHVDFRYSVNSRKCSRHGGNCTRLGNHQVGNWHVNCQILSS